MATLTKRTAAKMIDAVGAKIDIVLTTNTTPNRKQVVDWLNEGVIETIKLLPEESFRDLFVDYSSLGNEISESDLLLPVMKTISFFRNGASCVKITDKEFFSLLQNSPFKFTSMNPAYARITLGGIAIWRSYPTGKALNQIIYIPYPFMYDTGNGDEENETPTRYSIPALLENYVIDYAAAMARVQDEEPAQYQMYKQDWMNRVRMEHGLPIDPADGS